MKRMPFVALFGLFSLLMTSCARIITSGNYSLKSGDTLRDTLIITSGDILLEEGSRVAGSVFMTSGNLMANGEIDGNIWMTSGHVDIGPNAVIQGSIKKTSGTVQQAKGARVQGDASLGGLIFERALHFLAIVGAIIYVWLLGGRRQVEQEKSLKWKEKSSNL